MLWCHLQSVFCVLTVAAVSPRKRPLKVAECEPGPSWKVERAGQPCTTTTTTTTATTTTTTTTQDLATFKTPYPPLLSFAALFERQFGQMRVIDGPIRLTDGTDVHVGDRPVYNEIYADGVQFMRYLFTNDLVTITNMNLKNPSRLSIRQQPSQLNSTEWDIDHDSLVFNSHTITMIEEMFTYGVAAISSNATAKVLSIGLGGGYINSYLHRNYRRMNITVVEIDDVMLNISRKWFGLNEDSRQRVLIRDGVQYVREAANARKTFDVIFLDACTMDRNALVNCPSDSFLNLEVVQNLHTLLGARGILVVNVMAIRADHIFATHLVKEAFERSFRNCSAKYAPYAFPSIVMTCAEFDPPPGLRERYQQWKNYATTY